MPVNSQTGEFNTFVGGLVTEASPLTFPENASLDESNFVLNRDGSRRRRLGMNYEDGLGDYPATFDASITGDLQVVAFEWTDVADIPDKIFTVVQVQGKAYIIDRADPLLDSSSGIKFVFDLDNLNLSPARASFASIDGTLVVAYGAPTVKIVTYDSGTGSFDATDNQRLLVRDVFGVEDVFNDGSDDLDLLSPEYINYRPVSVADMDEHIYNLRNQGWAVPRLEWQATKSVVGVKIDPVTKFEDTASNNRGLPSNADFPTAYIFPDTENTGDRNTDRFNDDSAARSEPARSRAPVGHFIIDLLSRGSSRMAEVARLSDTYANANPAEVDPSITFRPPAGTAITLPADTTAGGAKVVAEFAGRVWYAGFSGVVTSGDAQSPHLTSYVLYSQLVKDQSQINKCYQAGDPTSIDESELLDTDGGFIRLAGASDIQRMINVGSGLMVLARNGVWFIRGGNDSSFSATSQDVIKITEHGTTSPSSAVLVDGTVMYWADNAIYHIAPDKVGNWAATDVSSSITTLYQSIDAEERPSCQGVYDQYDKKVRWLYNIREGSLSSPRELILDVVIGAYYPSDIGRLGTGDDPIPIAPIIVPPYQLGTIDLDVLAGADTVLSDTDSVVYSAVSRLAVTREVVYLTILNIADINDTRLITSTYSDATFLDWKATDSVGVDAPAHLLTGYVSNGDLHRHKQVPYIFFHFRRTETGFTDTGDDLVPVGESSCMVQSQWDWANSATYGKWSKSFQAYRYRRHYTPEDASDTYDYGTTTIISKSKLRGRGRVVSLLISSEEGKDMDLLGWSMGITTNGNV